MMIYLKPSRYLIVGGTCGFIYTKMGTREDVLHFDISVTKG